MDKKVLKHIETANGAVIGKSFNISQKKIHNNFAETYDIRAELIPVANNLTLLSLQIRLSTPSIYGGNNISVDLSDYIGDTAPEIFIIGKGYSIEYITDDTTARQIVDDNSALFIYQEESYTSNGWVELGMEFQGKSAKYIPTLGDAIVSSIYTFSLLIGLNCGIAPPHLLHKYKYSLPLRIL